MLDWIFNGTMSLFALLMLWLAFDDRIHTGFLGTLGAGGAAVQSLRIMDDSVLRSVDGTENAVLLLVLCLMCLVGNVTFSMWKAGVFDPVEDTPPDAEGEFAPPHPLRRRTDFGELDAVYSDANREERRAA